MTFRIATIPALLLALAAPAAFAEPFVAGSGGRTDWNADCSGASACETRGSAWTARLGYQFNPYVGIEARYADLGRLSSEFPSIVNIVEGGATTVTNGRHELHSSGGGIDVFVTSPPFAGFTFGAMGGIARMTGRMRTSIPSVGSDEVSSSSTKGYYGLRAAYAVWRNIDMSLEADRYRVAFPGGDASVDALSVGLIYHFR